MTGVLEESDKIDFIRGKKKSYENELGVIFQATDTGDLYINGHLYEDFDPTELVAVEYDEEAPATEASAYATQSYVDTQIQTVLETQLGNINSLLEELLGE